MTLPLTTLIIFQNVVEKVVYSANEESGLTVAERSVWIESRMYGLSRAIEAFALDRFRKNCAKAVKGFNYVLNNMFPVVSLPPVPEGAISPSVSGTEKLMGAAKKATHLAKTKAETIYVSASYQKSQT